MNMRLPQGVLEWAYAEPFIRQGPHPDPLSSPLPRLEPWIVTCLNGSVMPMYRQCLSLDLGPDEDIRQTVLSELSEYYGRSFEDSLNRCINWEDYSLEEWKQSDRNTPKGLHDFFQQCESWAYDLLWDAYLQSTGHSSPVSVAIVDWLIGRRSGGRHLDFGSGVGVTSQLFQQLGWRTTLADVSAPLLDFARWRLERRGVPAMYHDLQQPLPSESYDVITAVNSLIHVPDLRRAAHDLHAALVPNGLLFANFDVRPPSDYNSWHLYEDSATMRWAVESNGFTQLAVLAGEAGMYVYRKPTDSGPYRRQLPARFLRIGPPAQARQHSRRLLAGRVRSAVRAMSTKQAPKSAGELR
jgi:2-polyprenyl-3-methyl-5-hydroxy-6-metoxy-1,4-benzoquinol methylase